MKKYIYKKSFELNAPPCLLPPSPTHGAELWGAESLQSPTLTGPPARGSPNALLLQFLYIWGKSLICSLVIVGAFLLLSRGVASFWCQVCFCSSAVVNWHFSCPKSASVLGLCYSWYQLTWNCLQLEFSVNDRFKAGFHLKAVFTSLNVAFVPISHSRFKQRQIPPLRTFINVLRFCVNFWVISGHFVNEIFFLKG